MKNMNGIIHSKKGQGITELALILPLLLLLGMGVIEVANMINSYLTLTHLTREGANMASRGNTVDDGTENYGNPSAAGYDVLDAIVDSSAPVILGGAVHNKDQWLIIYSRITDLTGAGGYSVDIVSTRGNLGATSDVSTVMDKLGTVAAGQTFHVIEVFYNYAPSPCGGDLNCPLTPLQTFAGIFFPSDTPGTNFLTTFYDMSIFTDVS